MTIVGWSSEECNFTYSMNCRTILNTATFAFPPSSRPPKNRSKCVCQVDLPELALTQQPSQLKPLNTLSLSVIAGTRVGLELIEGLFDLKIAKLLLFFRAFSRGRAIRG